MGWAGFNCSMPHKVRVRSHLDGLGESAAIIGAVNCVVRHDERLIGENTDGQGFVRALRTVVDPAGQRVVIFGAGGAARAIAVELGLAGVASVMIVNRDPARGAELAALVNAETTTQADSVVWNAPYQLPPGKSAVVNATSIGLYPDVQGRLDIDLRTLEPHMIVADVIPTLEELFGTGDEGE